MRNATTHPSSYTKFYQAIARPDPSQWRRRIAGLRDRRALRSVSDVAASARRKSRQRWPVRTRRGRDPAREHLRGGHSRSSGDCHGRVRLPAFAAFLSTRYWDTATSLRSGGQSADGERVKIEARARRRGRREQKRRGEFPAPASCSAGGRTHHACAVVLRPTGMAATVLRPLAGAARGWRAYRRRIQSQAGRDERLWGARHIARQIHHAVAPSSDPQRVVFDAEVELARLDGRDQDGDDHGAVDDAGFDRLVSVSAMGRAELAEEGMILPA
jgi:hypothetical protein